MFLLSSRNQGILNVIEFKTACVVGLGYIGLPTSAVLASCGVRVYGFDVKEDVCAMINRAEIHITEPGLDELIQDVVGAGRFTAHSEPCVADVFIIAVPTPCHEEKADMSFVESATAAIASYLRPGNLVVLESTSPPGATRKMTEALSRLRPDLVLPGLGGESNVNVAYCPERVLPGKTMTELVENDRVIGGMSQQCSERAKLFYSTFCRGELLLTDSITAEMCKLTENSFRDVNLAFANELSNICERLSINVWDLIRLANHHPRVNILQPGPGVGGHCIPVDPWFIVEAAPEEAVLLRTARHVNDARPKAVIEKVTQVAARLTKTNGRQPVIGVFGLAFKADVDDFRESPAVEIASELMQRYEATLICEPYAVNLSDIMDPRNATLVVDVGEMIALSDILVLLVDHAQFRSVPKSLLAGKQIVDTRGIWS